MNTSRCAYGNLRFPFGIPWVFAQCGLRALARLVACAVAVHAGQVCAIDITGPAGSVHFGTSVTVLPNGNIVVTDPDADSATRSGVGAVYLYSPSGNMISTVTGSNNFDHIGSYVRVLTNGNYAIVSPQWRNNAVADAGAVTWGGATTGVSGVVSASNSLVGSTAEDQIGIGAVTALSNGNYVISSPHWDNGGIVDAGAVTWCDGNGGTVGAVSAGNSLVGTSAGDNVGYFQLIALSNGNYVAMSPLWDNGAVADVGAVTWGSGNGGTIGTVSASNSLVGSAAGDEVGGVIALSNGNYVVNSSSWGGGGTLDVGAVTWGNGNGGTVGVVSASNSLIGTTEGDEVGNGVVALSNGNYVSFSARWNNFTGAATWGNGNGGTVGAVSASNSLVGGSAGDRVGVDGVTALSNGNYVVLSSGWNGKLGAATWGNGNGGTTGTVSASNSLVGSVVNDYVGSTGVATLSNGNYVVRSPLWNNGATVGAGAATWGDGNGGTMGAVSVGNSLIGATDNDNVGGSVTALTNGNYVVGSSSWDNGGIVDAGAVTWGDGNAGGAVGVVSASNSLVGSSASDNVGYPSVTALTNGNYIVGSASWNNGSTVAVGAATWGDGNGATAGAVSASNSLVGGSADDVVALNGVTALSNGDYAVASPSWDNGSIVDAGAITLRRASEHLGATITAQNSVRGEVASSGDSMVFDYDPARGQLVVGRPAENIVTLFKADLLLRNGFD